MRVEREFSDRIWRTLSHCRDLGLSNHCTVVMGSAALYLAGVLRFGQDGFPRDIDILVTSTDKFEEACNNYGWDMGCTNGCVGRLVHIKHPDDELDLEFTQHWPIRRISDVEIAEHSEFIQGVRIMRPSFDLASMQELHRPKDCARIPVVRERVFGRSMDAFVPWRLVL